MREKLRKWFNADNIIDATVDLFLILFDVLASPILIVMRLARYVVGKYMLNGVKNKIKKVAHLKKVFLPIAKIRNQRRTNEVI